MADGEVPTAGKSSSESADRWPGNEVVGGRIARARRDRGLTQGDLASQIGTSLGVLNRYERGDADPRPILERVAEATGRPVEWFTAGSPDTREGTEPEGRGDPGELRSRIANAMTGRSAGSEPSDAPASAAPAALWAPPPASAPSEAAAPAPEAASPEPAAPPPVEAATPAEPPERRDGVLEADGVPRHETLPRTTFGGFSRKATAELFDEISEAYRRLSKDCVKLQERIAKLEGQLGADRNRGAAAVARSLSLESDLQGAKDREAELAGRLDHAETQLEEHRRRETALGEALVLAKETAAEVVADAERRASELVRSAEEEVERLAAERTRLEDIARGLQQDLSSFLMSTLERLKGSRSGAPAD